MSSTSPSATPAAPRKSGPGCLAALIALPVVILVGVIVGTVLSRPDDPPEEKAVTVAEGEIDGVEWRVDAERDVEGEVCAFLYEDGVQLTGACDDTPQDATFGTETVVFGQAGSDEPLEVVFTNGESVEVTPEQVDGIDGWFYAEVVPGDLDVDS